MRKQIITVALAGSLGLTGAALLTPTLASAQTATPSAGASVLTDRVAAIKDALKGLVSDDTLTQAQADRVATTLADQLPVRGHGGRGPHGGRVSPEATAEAAGATVAELQAAREAGQTLAQLAESNGVSKATLISRLVKAAEAQLAADVTAGRLTQAQADEVKSTLTARITDKVDRVGHGPGGRGHHRHGDDAPATSATPSPGA